MSNDWKLATLVLATLPHFHVHPLLSTLHSTFYTLKVVEIDFPFVPSELTGRTATVSFFRLVISIKPQPSQTGFLECPALHFLHTDKPEYGKMQIMQTLERTFTIDRDLARRADRKLHRYGMSLDDALAKTLVFVVSTRGNPWGETVRPVPSVIEFDTQGEHFVADVTREGNRYLAEVRGHPECFTEGGNEAELRQYLVEVTDGMLFGLGEKVSR